ncbi:MAG: nucleoside deaminase [bacterium]
MFPEIVYKNMSYALAEAAKAYDKDEIPVGAVIVKNNIIVGKGYNQVEHLKDPTAHAEIIAITAACNKLESKYLDDCDIYVTLEPCVMCAGAIILSRINTIYFGAFEPKFGACGSLFNIVENKNINHSPKIYSGIYENYSKELLTEFFNKKR